MPADDAERVAVGVGQHHPAEVVADAVPADLGGAGGGKARNFGIHVSRAEIQVNPVLTRRGIGNLLKAEPRPFGPDHREEFAGEQFLGLAVEMLGPPTGQLRGIAASRM